MRPVAARNEQALVRQQIGHPHTRLKGVAQGRGHVALQGDYIGNLRADLEHREHVTGFHGLLQARRIEREIFNIACDVAVGVHALELRLVRRRQHGQTTRERQYLTNGLANAQFVYRRGVDGAQHGGTRARRGNVNHVTGQQGRVSTRVALGQKGIQVHAGYGFAAAAQLNGAQAAVAGGAAGLKQGVDQARQAADHVFAGLARLAHHKHLDAAQPPQRDANTEVAVHLADVTGHHGLGLAKRDARQVQGPDFGHHDAAIAVNHQAGVDVEQAVDLHHHLVAWAQDVARRHGRTLQGGKVVGLAKQLVAVQAQGLARGSQHETLELDFVGLGLFGFLGLANRFGSHQL